MSVFRQQAVFVRNVQIKRCNIYIYIYIYIGRCYLEVSISQFEKTTVKVLQQLVLANVFEGSVDFPRWAFFIDAAVMLALLPLGLTMYINICMYIYIYMLSLLNHHTTTH